MALRVPRETLPQFYSLQAECGNSIVRRDVVLKSGSESFESLGAGVQSAGRPKGKWGKWRGKSRKEKKKRKLAGAMRGARRQVFIYPPISTPTANQIEKKITTARCTPKIPKAKELQPSPQIWREPEGEQSRAFLQTQNSPKFQLLTLTTLPAVRTKTHKHSRGSTGQKVRESAWHLLGRCQALHLPHSPDPTLSFSFSSSMDPSPHAEAHPGAVSIQMPTPRGDRCGDEGERAFFWLGRL